MRGGKEGEEERKETSREGDQERRRGREIRRDWGSEWAGNRQCDCGSRLLTGGVIRVNMRMRCRLTSHNERHDGSYNGGERS